MEASGQQRDAKAAEKGQNESVIEVYANAVNFGVSVWDITMEFSIRQGDGSLKPLVRVRTSPQHALAMAKLLAKNMRAYEEQAGKINLPRDLYRELGIDEHSW